MMVRENLKKALVIVIDGTNNELIDHYNRFKEEFMVAELNRIAKPSGISDIDKYQNPDFTIREYEYVHDENRGHLVKKKLTIPNHVRGAITYNRLVRDMKLQNKYEYIKNGSKIKLLQLKLPNPINAEVIGFIGEIPPEFGLADYVSREIQFDKLYKSPLESFTVFNNWILEKNVMRDLFGDVDNASVMIEKKKIKKEKKVMKTSSLF